MSIIMIFNRKVIPVPPLPGEKAGNGKVEVDVVGFNDGEPFTPGMLKFPNKQVWTKFWGALQRGALQVPELEVKMENVPPTEEELNGQPAPPPDPELLKHTTDVPPVKFIGKQS
ncbi:MAG TPA: hypothetical protein VH593_11165 [Ktedonobacteraceae bacterium]|jgi:hypothetical protein